MNRHQRRAEAARARTGSVGGDAYRVAPPPDWLQCAQCRDSKAQGNLHAGFYAMPDGWRFCHVAAAGSEGRLVLVVVCSDACAEAWTEANVERRS